nr:MAG TPA: hypothetical protein [Caudoviricetes sp.]
MGSLARESRATKKSRHSAAISSGSPSGQQTR